jgi:hypothetical protein
LGTANKQNCKISYYAEMAQKRSKARLVLEMSGFYSVGVYSEIEADEFKSSHSNTKPQDTGIADEINKLNAGDEGLGRAIREYNE